MMVSVAVGYYGVQKALTGKRAIVHFPPSYSSTWCIVVHAQPPASGLCCLCCISAFAQSLAGPASLAGM